MEVTGRATQFTRESLIVQCRIATKVAQALGSPTVYIFDSSCYFVNAPTRVVDTYRYKYRDQKIAVLSETAQHVFDNWNEYTQFLMQPWLRDEVGVYLKLS